MKDNIGRSWNSTDGKKTIHELVYEPEGPRYIAGTRGPGRGGDLIPPEELEQWIKVDESWYQFHAALDHEQKHKEYEKQEALEQVEREDTDGYADQFPPMKRGKIIKALNKELRYQGKRMTVKELVRMKRADGWFANGDYIEHRDGTCLRSRDITTKYAVYYMAHLVHQAHLDNLD